MVSSRRSLGEQVASALLLEIVEGRHPSGTLLPGEWELAQQHDVSRLTVREAIGSLRQKGVVQVRHGVGTVVLPPESWSPLDPAILSARAADGQESARIRAFLEARRLLESGCAELAAARRTTPDISALHAAHEAMAAAGDDVDAFLDAEDAFRTAVVAAARNPVLAALVAPLGQLLRDTQRVVAQEATARRLTTQEFRRVLEAVQDGSRERAGAEMREHLHRTERLGEQLAANRSATASPSTRSASSPSPGPPGSRQPAEREPGRLARR